MKTGNNQYLDLIRLWQEKTQAFFNDPKTIEIMMQNMQNTQDFFQKMQESSYEYNNFQQDSSSSSNELDAINVLTKRIVKLEERIQQLEFHLSSNKQ